MAKLKDFLLEVNKHVDSDELVALAGASNISDIQIEDSTLDKIKTKFGSFLTIESAKNSPEIIDYIKSELKPQIKKSVLANIDSQLLQTSRDLFGDQVTSELNGIESSYERIKKFAEFAKDAIESQDGGDEKIKTLNVGLNKQVADLRLDMDKVSKANEKEIKKLNTGFTEKLIDKEFSATFHSYTLGDKYSESFFKNALRDQIRKDVTKVAKLTLSDEGDIIPKNPENIDMELFIQNKPVKTLKDVMDPLMASHIKVNNVDPTKLKDGYIPAKEVKLSVQAQEFVERRKQLQVK